MQPFEKIGMKSVVKEISKLISVYSLLATVLKKKEKFLVSYWLEHFPHNQEVNIPC